MYTRSNPNCFETVISLIWISWLKYKTIDHRCQNVLFEIFKKVIQLGAKWSDMTFNQMKYNIYNILLFYEMPYCEILNPIPARPAVFPFFALQNRFLGASQYFQSENNHYSFHLPDYIKSLHWGQIGFHGFGIA